MLFGVYMIWILNVSAVNKRTSVFFAFELDKLALLLSCSGGQGFIYMVVKSVKCEIFQFRSLLERLNYIKLHFAAMNIILWIFALFLYLFKMFDMFLCHFSFIIILLYVMDLI